MVGATSSLTPKTTVAVASPSQLTDSQRLVLDRLYQPILGVSAFSLVSTFWREVDAAPHHRLEVPHTHFLRLLNMDLPTLEGARKRLEAVGLLRSFHRSDQAMPEWLYALEAPVASDVFFSDNLLSLLLLEIVGEQQFKELALAFKPQAIDHTGFSEATEQFLNVFHVDNRLIATPPTIIQKVQRSTATPTAGSGVADLTPAPSSFDFKLLAAILERSYVDPKALQENRRLILNEVALYGLTETEMATYITDATNLATNQVDVNRLKASIAGDRQKSPVRAPKNDSTDSTPPTPASKSEKGELTAQEQSLIKLANELSPMAFLEAIREEQGGYVASGERRIVEQLADQQVFSHAVINILVFYLLNDMEQPTLTQRLTDSVAIPWAQHGVKTPYDAVVEIHRFRANRAKRASQPRRNASGRKNVKETLPDWAKEDYKPKSSGTQLSDAQRAKMAEQLKRLNDRNGGDNDNGKH